MSYREVVSAAKRLPLGERLRLVEELLREMRQTATMSVHSRRRHLKPFSQLRGALKSEIPSPNDSEIEDGHVQHLIDKYL